MEDRLPDNLPEHNPYMKARSVEELRQMEQDLVDQCWKDGKILPHMEEYYEEQMILFTEAFATLFPDEYDYHRKGRKATGKD
jgi:hypothetical protein